MAGCKLEVSSIVAKGGMSLSEAVTLWFDRMRRWSDEWTGASPIVRWVWLDDESLFKQAKFRALVQSL